MDINKIYTESAEDEQWKLITKYSYLNNIKKYFKNNHIKKYNNNLLENISGSILQAKDYCDASRSCSLHINPLLLYYSASNLLFGIASLKLGEKINIKDHGMTVNINKYKYISDIEIIPKDPKNGALNIYTQIFSEKINICSSGKWTLSELFGSIPDLRDEYLNCYSKFEPYVIPVETIKDKNSTFERINKSDLQRFKDINSIFSRVNGFKENYLTPQILEGSEYLILRRKLQYNEIGDYSLSGKKYISIGYIKNGKLINTSLIIKIFMALFALGYICRYRPDIWNPFIRQDTTGEKLLIERFIFLSRRLLPNYILNFLLDKNIYFITEHEKTTNISDKTSKDEIQTIVKEELRKYFEQKRLQKQ